MVGWYDDTCVQSIYVEQWKEWIKEKRDGNIGMAMEIDSRWESLYKKKSTTVRISYILLTIS